MPADIFFPETMAARGSAALIKEMINSSQLEPIREVRRDEKLMKMLLSKLEQLVASTTLDKMQLASFVESLRNPVHLTQGPPGTGMFFLSSFRALNITTSIS
jgi:hypothetical protein